MLIMVMVLTLTLCSGFTTSNNKIIQGSTFVNCVVTSFWQKAVDHPARFTAVVTLRRSLCVLSYVVFLCNDNI